MASSDNPASVSPLEVHAPGTGFWRLRINLPAGDWGVCWLVAGGQRIARCDSAQELLVCGGRQVSLQLMPDEAAPVSGMTLETAPVSAGELLGTIWRQVRLWPRAATGALWRQWRQHGLLAVPQERSVWPETGKLAKEVEFLLAPGAELRPGAAERIAALFDDPSVAIVSWDIAGTPDGILPPPSPELHKTLPYTWRGWARRKGAADREAPGTVAPGAWRHLHEPLATAPASPVPSVPAALEHASDTVAPTVSVIIPTRDRPHLLRACLEGLERSSPQPDQIVLVDHLTEDPEALAMLEAAEAAGAVRVRTGGAFNFSRLINLGAAVATGEVLVCLNNDVTPLSTDWLARLAETAARPDTGVVGAELHYPDGRLQHAGIVNSPEYGPQHVCTGWPSSERGPLNVLDYRRECLAVTGAVLATRRQVFDEMGGFDEAFPEDYNDVDYCLRVHKAGYACLIEPAARLVHQESRSRSVLDPESEEKRLSYLEALRKIHPNLTARDPWFSPRWSTRPPVYRPARWDC